MDTGTPQSTAGARWMPHPRKELAIPGGLGCPRPQLGMNLGSGAQLVLGALGADLGPAPWL